ncbi:uncharacterized protein LOC110862991 [Folsomia candida]|uniref:uncharacterized protein LOC110862991 n=1 Tax=Folsomia candida TaxID=158441 RepID=UPI000B9047B1|nr:uncharacterized protein LOC110862991 [Folsomia candida]XP_035702380.1 uncharacterized protein LOC110862991 [Folsomia candida]XP_035702381.1 uncharacterized protein LOC110862991 [Folsomia candida]
MTTPLDRTDQPDFQSFILNPLDIPTILSKILAYLPLHDLRSTRLVNSTWKLESDPYYLEEGIFRFDTSRRIAKLNRYIASYLHEGWRHRNFSLDPTIPTDCLKAFFNICGIFITSLELSKVSHHNFNFLRDTPNLVKLSLRFVVDDVDGSKFVRTLNSDTLQLKNLQIFNVGIRFWRYLLPSEITMVAVYLLQLCRNVTTLKFEEGYCDSQLQNVCVQLISERDELVPNLRNITTSRFGANMVKMLKAMDRPVTGIKCGINLKTEEELNDLEIIMMKFSQTLEVLELDVLEVHKGIGNEFTFVKMPQLRKLAIRFLKHDDANCNLIELIGRKIADKAILKERLPQLQSYKVTFGARLIKKLHN